MKFAWRTVHILTAVSQLCLLAQLAWEIATTGNLHRTPNAGGNFDTSFAIYMALLFSGSAASAVRALWLESAA